MKKLEQSCLWFEKSFGAQASTNFEDFVSKKWTKAFLNFKK